MNYRADLKQVSCIPKILYRLKDNHVKDTVYSILLTNFAQSSKYEMFWFTDRNFTKY